MRAINVIYIKVNPLFWHPQGQFLSVRCSRRTGDDGEIPSLIDSANPARWAKSVVVAITG
jgi:hypothetical protein